MDFFGRREPDKGSDQTSDAQALARYRYMLSTAPPEDIERAHEEAFAKLTPEQRRSALQALAGHVPATEIRGDDPASLARTATRAEVRQPGTIERAWGGAGGAGFGLGSFFFSMLAASFIGTAIAQTFFDNDPAAAAAADGQAGGEGDGSDADQGADEADGGGADGGGADGGGDGGGDYGGGDFGGGDMGGGDFGDFGGF